jgi:hypothetical protein
MTGLLCAACRVKTTADFGTPRAAPSRLGMGSTPQPPMSVVARKSGVTPIAALNPYDTRVSGTAGSNNGMLYTMPYASDACSWSSMVGILMKPPSPKMNDKYSIGAASLPAGPGSNPPVHNMQAMWRSVLTTSSSAGLSSPRQALSWAPVVCVVVACCVMTAAITAGAPPCVQAPHSGHMCCVHDVLKATNRCLAIRLWQCVGRWPPLWAPTLHTACCCPLLLFCSG